MKAKTLLATLSAAVIALAALLYLQTGPLQTQAGKTVFESTTHPTATAAENTSTT
jgi:hypothetical protein